MSRANALEKPDTQPRRKVLALNLKQAAHDLDAKGFAVLPKLLTLSECTALTALYSDDLQFRSRIDMARHGFGRGKYKYFSYPLPALYCRFARLLSIRRWRKWPTGGMRRWACALSGRAYGISPALPSGRSNASDTAAAEVRRRRLQLPASGCLRRARLSVAGRHAAARNLAAILPAASSC